MSAFAFAVSIGVAFIAIAVVIVLAVGIETRAPRASRILKWLVVAILALITLALALSWWRT